MIKLKAIFALFMAQFFLGPTAYADDNYDIPRVAQASAMFVERFNAKDSAALKRLYTRNGVLKLPNALAISGNQNVANAWQGGFDAGLDFLVLSVESLTSAGNNKVLENGTYELTIQTPDGPIVQAGTFSVLWRVPDDLHRSPRIMFDAIDAN